MSQQSLLKSELDHIKNNGPVTIFWVTYSKARATRIAKAQAAGALVRLRDEYPVMRFRVCMAKMPKI
jgi:hypothetical protein